MDDYQPTNILVLRDDDLEGTPIKFSVPAGSEFDEIKEKLFKLAFPGNPEVPWECKLITGGKADIDDINVLIAVPDGKIIVVPGPSFVDKQGKKKQKELKEREKEKERELQKEQKEKEKKEKEEEKKKEKEEHQKEKEEHKDEKAFKSPSFFDTFKRKPGVKNNLERKGSVSSVGSGQSGTPSEGGKDENSFRPSDYAKVYVKGYLCKKNEVLSNGKIPNRNWLTYWVVLRSHYLMFYKERKHYTAQKDPIGGLSIKGCELTPIFDYKKREHVFRLKTNRGASYLMEAESLEEMTAWLTYIEQASKLALEEEEKWSGAEGKSDGKSEKEEADPKESNDLHQESFDEDPSTPNSNSNAVKDDDTKEDNRIKLSPQEEKALEEEERRIEQERLERAAQNND